MVFETMFRFGSFCQSLMQRSIFFYVIISNIRYGPELLQQWLAWQRELIADTVYEQQCVLFLGKVGSSEADTRIIVWPQVCLDCGLKWIALMLLRRRRPIVATSSSVYLSKWLEKVHQATSRHCTPPMAAAHVNNKAKSFSCRCAAPPPDALLIVVSSPFTHSEIESFVSSFSFLISATTTDLKHGFYLAMYLNPNWIIQQKTRKVEVPPSPCHSKHR